MAQPNFADEFPFDSNTPVLERMGQLMAALDARFAPLESERANWEATLLELKNAGGQQVADTLRPLYEDMLGVLTLGTLFSTSSLTVASIRLGLATFIIPQGQWGIFNPPAFMAAIPADDPDAFMSGRFKSFDRSTGALVFDVTTCVGSGSHATWAITPATPVIIPKEIDPGFYDQDQTVPLGPPIQFGEDVGAIQPIGTY